jgi:hypothetical protein
VKHQIIAINTRHEIRVCARKIAFAALLLTLSLLPCGAQSGYFDLAPFARPLPQSEGTGLVWDEERDIRELQVTYSGEPSANVSVEYWFKNWPYPKPKMPTIEDPMDDPWQGEWRRANAQVHCDAVCVYTFDPLTETENPLATNLPGVRYRRTLKIRLTSPSGAPQIKSLRAFSDSKQKPVQVHIDLGTPQAPELAVFNGVLRSVKPAGNGVVADLIASEPAPSGSHDITIVTVRASEGRNFSFSVEDLKRGPVVIPAFHARITAEGPTAAPAIGESIRKLIALQPEQSYERASREIPPLDPWEREGGGRLYLPLAVDASWQKFAFEIGGNVFISKQGTKAKGAELGRLKWSGDKLTWKIGTGEKPYFREDRKATISTLEDRFPVATQHWESDGYRYSEEAFATLLDGPLDPNDPARNEQTPAVLLVRLTAENPGGAHGIAHIWLKTNPDESLRVDGPRVMAGSILRAHIDSVEGSPVSIENGYAHVSFEVPKGKSRTTTLRLPFVSDLGPADFSKLAALDYEVQRDRVIRYWRDLQSRYARFSVPEPRFNNFLESVIDHIRISTTKDPRSGLYMVPAASYNYQVFANEAAFQSLLMDTLSDTKTSSEYLETLMKLQGSRNFPGTHKGSYAGVLHGAKVDDNYDYTASGYGLDHGTVLWVLAEHYLYTRDREWLQHAWPHMAKAVDWIVDQRATTMHQEDGRKSRDYGLLPAAQLEDNSDWANWFANNGYAWAGLDRTAKALADIGSPEAARVRREADAYAADLRAAVLRATEDSPVVRLRDGTYSPYVPVLPFRRLRLFGPVRLGYYDRYGMPDKPMLRLSADREILYGPMILLNLGLFGPNEPIADWILNDWEDNQTLSSGMGMNVHGMTDDRYWFSQGGMVWQANLQNPINVYLRRHEVPAAIRSLYNSFTACLYPDVNAFTEEFRQWRHASGPFYKIPDEARFVNRVRDLLVLEEGDNLWLAPGTPRRWLSSPDGIHVNGLLTYFGPVSYTIQPSSAPHTVKATVELPTRNPPQRAWLVVRAPGKVYQATINGTPANFDREREAIELPPGGKSLRIEVRYR